MAYGGTPSYSDWLNANPELVNQAIQNTGQTAPVAQVTPAQVQPVQPVQPQAQGPSNYQKTAQVVQAVTGPDQARQEAPYALRSSAYGSGPMTQSDAPGAAAATPMKGRANKIMEIVGAVMSFGATKVASQAAKNSGGQNG